MARRRIARSPGSAGRPPRGAVELLRRELRDDRVTADVTTRTLIPKGRVGEAFLVAQGAGTLSGLSASTRLARSVGLRATPLRHDGDRVVPGTRVLRLRGDLRWILGIERTVLNALMHLSGVATETAAAVAEVRAAGGGVEVYATRKTLPGLRELEKAAVVHGGGHPHRRDLSEAALVKGPHLVGLGIPEAVLRLRRRGRTGLRIQVEVRSAAEAIAAARAGADALLLDNLGPAEARSVLRRLRTEGLRERVFVELSGGITPANVGRFARTGADAVSLGAITHSARALPFHLVRTTPRAA